MFDAAQRAIVVKDLRVLFARRATWLPIVLLPAVLCVLLPAGLIVATWLLRDQAAKDGAEMLRQMGLPNTYGNPQTIVLGVMVDHVFPLLFLLIPTMVCAVLGASGFVAEREQKTMETLLYGPITASQLYVAKLVGALVPAILVMLGSAVLFGLVIDVGGWLAAGVVLFPTARWLVVIFWVAPAIALVALSVIVWVSGRATSSQEAQQQTMLIVMPIVLLVVGQVTGLLLLNVPMLLGGGAVLHVLGFTLLRRLRRGFTPERLV